MLSEKEIEERCVAIFRLCAVTHSGKYSRHDIKCFMFTLWEINNLPEVSNG